MKETISVFNTRFTFSEDLSPCKGHYNNARLLWVVDVVAKEVLVVLAHSCAVSRLLPRGCYAVARGCGWLLEGCSPQPKSK